MRRRNTALVAYEILVETICFTRTVLRGFAIKMKYALLDLHTFKGNLMFQVKGPQVLEKNLHLDWEAIGVNAVVLLGMFLQCLYQKAYLKFTLQCWEKQSTRELVNVTQVTWKYSVAQVSTKLLVPSAFITSVRSDPLAYPRLPRSCRKSTKICFFIPNCWIFSSPHFVRRNLDHCDQPSTVFSTS